MRTNPKKRAIALCCWGLIENTVDNLT